MVKVVFGVAGVGLGVIAVAAGAWWFLVREDDELATAPKEIPDELIDPTAIPAEGATTAPAGTSNYVVFDDSLIDIIRKYMVGAPIPLAPPTTQQRQDMRGVY